MGELQKTVRLSELTEVEQRIVRDFLPLIKKNFTPSGMAAEAEADNEQYKEGVKRFLAVFTDVFSILPPKSNIENAPDNILKQSIAKFRAVYRKQFRGVLYLPGKKIFECYKQAEKEADATLNRLAKDSQVTEEHKKELDESLNSMISEEALWIYDVNTFQKSKILESIKSEILESFRTDIENKFPYLYGRDETHFYDEEKLELDYKEMIKTAMESFQEQIPFQEDNQDLQEINDNFEKELQEKVTDETVRRNSNNKDNAKSILEATVDRALTTYKTSISTFIEKEPLMEPHHVLEHHQNLKKELTPAPTLEQMLFKLNGDIGMDNLHIEYLNKYHNQLQEQFEEVLNQSADLAASNLVKCQIKSKDIAKRCAEEIQAVFEEFKLPNTCSEKLQKKFEGNVKEVIQAIRGISLANAKNVENLLIKSKPARILTKAEKTQREAQITGMLTEFKTQYTDKMLQLTSRDKRVDKRQHESVKNEVVKLLQMEIRKKIGEDQSSEKHEEVLREFCEESWEKSGSKKNGFQPPTPESWIFTSPQNDDKKMKNGFSFANSSGGASEEPRFGQVGNNGSGFSFRKKDSSKSWTSKFN